MNTDHDALIAEVIRANGDFYAAFQAMDLDRMAGIWAQRDADICIHPGWEVLQGWLQIRESWRVIFASTDFLRFSTTDTKVEILGTAARVTCVENLYQVFGNEVGQSRVAATNLYIRTVAGWRLVLHQGSPIFSPDDAEPAGGDFN